MTAVWGPLGWMTLHSVAHNYPENPTPTEKQLVAQWLDSFRDCITCPSCQGHFAGMLAQVRTAYPDYLDSRRNFLLFTYRAHNTVNRRLDKPVYLTAEECEEVYRLNIEARSAKNYREAYLNHIARHWSYMRDMNGISAMRKIQDLRRIERDYWAPRESGLYAMVGESTTPYASASSDPRPTPVFRPPTGGVRFAGGRLRFGRR